MTTYQMKIVPSQDMNGHDDPGISAYNWQFLSQGDSWFSTNTLKWSPSNLLENLLFPQAAAVVNCADPGDTLAHMVDTNRDPLFYSLLAGPKEQAWNAILLSGGGNDLIDAVQVGPADANGVPVAPLGRLLLTKDEWGTALADAASPYISASGWSTFRTHLEQQYQTLDYIRSKSRQNQSTPIFTHTYDYATPRDSGAGANIGPWLYPALKTYQIDPNEWDVVADVFIDKLGAIILGMAAQIRNFHPVDTRGTLTRAAAGATGISNDWENEIHATAGGYAKLGLKITPVIAATINMAALAPTLTAMVSPDSPVVAPRRRKPGKPKAPRQVVQTPPQTPEKAKDGDAPV